MDLLRHQRVHRTIEHTGLCHRPYADVVEILGRAADDLAADATSAADDETRRLAHIGRKGPIERLEAVIGPLTGAGDHHAFEISWTGDGRLLASTTARVDLRPIIRSGTHATTELRLRADHEPPPSFKESPERVLFGRRVARAGLIRFVDDLVRGLEAYEETFVPSATAGR